VTYLNIRFIREERKKIYGGVKTGITEDLAIKKAIPFLLSIRLRKEIPFLLLILKKKQKIRFWRF